jgi:hypothetical protein
MERLRNSIAERNRYFTINLGFEKMHATHQMLTSALQLYFTGESFRNVQKFLKLQGVKTCYLQMDKKVCYFNEIILKKN